MHMLPMSSRTLSPHDRVVSAFMGEEESYAHIDLMQIAICVKERPYPSAELPMISIDVTAKGDLYI